MPESMNEITITIPASEAAQRHIEDLQALITKRNMQIERLSLKLEEMVAGEPNQKALKEAYQDCWKAAANHLTVATASAAQALGKVRKDAFQIYLRAGVE